MCRDTAQVFWSRVNRARLINQRWAHFGANTLATVFLTVAISSFASVLRAQASSPLPDWASQRAEVPRRALVIGVGPYLSLEPIKSPPHDAKAIAERLEARGFQVTQLSGAVLRETMLAAFETFADGLSQGDVALLYFSGHGFERNGTNYLVAADAPKSFEANRVDFVAIPLWHITERLQRSGASLSIIWLDACRDDPFPQAGEAVAPTQRKGLAPIRSVATGAFMGFAAAPGQASFGGLSNDPDGMPSLFSRHLAAFVGQEGRSVFWSWREAGARVYRDSGQRQMPWYNADALFPEFKLAPSATDLAEMQSAWQLAVSGSDPNALLSDLEEYLRHFPDSPYAGAARSKISELRAQRRDVSANSDLTAQELKTRIALQTSILAGSVVSNSLTGTFADFSRIFTTSPIKVYAAAHTSSNVLTEVPKSAELAAVSLPDADGWMAVRFKRGTIGYIGNVSAVKLPPTTLETQLKFRAADATIISGDLDRITDALRSSASIAVIEVSGASTDLPDRARKLTYLRGLTIRSALREKGVPQSRIRLSLVSRNPAATDEASIRLLEP